MEARIYELKALKKQYKALRCRAVRGWKLLSILCWVLLAAVAGIYAMVRLPENFLTPYWQWLLGKLPFDLSAIAAGYGLYAMAALGLLILIWGIAWGIKGKKTKKTQEFLSHQTLKRTLKAEKKER